MKFLALCVVIALTLLAPGLAMPLGLPTLHLGDVLILIGFLAVATNGRESFGRMLFSPNLRMMTLPYFALLSYLLLVTIATALPAGADLSVMGVSIFASLSFFRPFLLLVLIVNLRLPRNQLHLLCSFCVLLLLLQVFLVYAQSVDLGGVNGWLTRRYISSDAPGKLLKSYESGWRMIGSYGNPNHLGTGLAILGTLAFGKLLFGPGKFSRIMAGAAVSLSLVVLVWLAKTRQGTACLLGGCALLLIMCLFSKQHRIWAIFVGAAAFVGLSLLVGLMSADREIATRFAFLTRSESVLADESFRYRVGTWAILLEEIGPYLVVGRGQLWLLQQGSVTDNGFVALLVLGGVIALGLYLIMVLAPAVAAAKRIMRNGLGHPDSGLHSTVIALVGPVLLANISNTVLNSGRVMYTAVIVYALSFAAMKAEDAAPDVDQNALPPLPKWRAPCR